MQEAGLLGDFWKSFHHPYNGTWRRVMAFPLFQSQDMMNYSSHLEDMTGWAWEQAEDGRAEKWTEPGSLVTSLSHWINHLWNPLASRILMRGKKKFLLFKFNSILFSVTYIRNISTDIMTKSIRTKKIIFNTLQKWVCPLGTIKIPSKTK